MTEIKPNTELSVPLGNTLDVQGAHFQGITTYNLTDGPAEDPCAEDIESLKAKMKLQLVQEETGFEQLTKGELSGKYSSGHELSTSLPNLSEGLDITSMNKVNEKHIRSSLTNIYDKPETVNSEVSKTSLPDHSKQVEDRNIDIQTIISPVQDESRPLMRRPADSVSPKLVHPATGKPQELTISVSSSNNRLSAVLENIPLLYIPQTKQLISCIGPKSVGALSAIHGSNGNDAENVSQNGQHASSQENKSHLPNGSARDEEITSSGDKKLCNGIVNGSSDQSSSPESPAETQATNKTLEFHNSNGHCSGSDQESSGLLHRQDSDTSSLCQSDHTVVHPVPNNPKDIRSVDFDEISLDRLSKLSIEKESPRNSLQRTNTIGSLSRTDASSFSSISSISTGTDFSISAVSYNDDYSDIRAPIQDPDETGFMEVNLHSRNSYERSRTSSQDSGIDEKCHGANPKRRGITGFLARSLFSRKAKEQQAESGSQSAPGWKLFGRVPLKQAPQKDPNKISEEYQAKCKAQQQLHEQQQQHQQQQQQQQYLPVRGKKTDLEVSSTTALILEQRPVGLPSKDPEEEERHRQEYEAMVLAAKKREMREAKLRKKQLAAQLKQEEILTAALKVWNTEILPNWETTKNSKRARELWWSGIPPSVRGKVWQLAIGNELNLTPELYEICLNRAKDRLKLINETGDSDSLCEQEPASCKESSVEVIKLDVSRTFPQLCIFQKGGPYHELLQGLLGAYACYRPDVGYVQGMSFIAAVLLLNMDVNEAFICFANLLNRPCQVAFFRVDENLMKYYFLTYEEFFNENLSRLYSHFNKQGLTPDLYIIDWMFTLYSKSLPLDVASRVWDVFCRDGEEFLFRTALGILRMYEEVLLNMDFIHLAQFLTKLPDNISVDLLFSCIDKIYMMVDNKRFNQVLAGHRDQSQDT